MNSQFKLNLLNTLSNKKSNKGFTLIELLVVVIIIGVLAAIALPNLLGQVGKARESEAKSIIGALNRAQQAYYTEWSQFAPAGNAPSVDLEVPTGNEKYYDQIYLPALGVQTARNEQNDRDNTRDYVGGTQYDQTLRTFATIVIRLNEDEDIGADGANFATYIENAGTVADAAATGMSIPAGANAKTVR
ncbi:MAG: type IV pilin protein [Microcystaceae cyanobacterium]